MADLRIIEVRDLLRVSTVAINPYVIPRTVTVHGQDFRYALEVWINETKSPSVFIQSNTMLLAQVPDSQLTSPIRTVSVVSSQLTATEISKIEFRVGNMPGTVGGISQLIQNFIKLLLQDPGSDIFARNLGGGLLRAVGQQTSKSGQSLVADLQMGVDRTRKQIMTLQAGDRQLRPSEKLLYARLLDARFLVSELTVMGKIMLGNHAHQTASVNLEL